MSQSTSPFTLFSYYRSSAAWRVRLALNLKKIRYETIEIDLLKNDGEQKQTAYTDINPQALVPTLKNGKLTLTQSLAIAEYLDELQPEFPLIFGNTEQRAEIRQFCHIIAMDIHPLNNLRVQKYLMAEMEITEDQKNTWYAHWIQQGFEALEKKLEASGGSFCFGDQLSLADCCLIPQVYNARRFKVVLDDYPLITAIDKNCMQLDSFKTAHPDHIGAK